MRRWAVAAAVAGAVALPGCGSGGGGGSSSTATRGSATAGARSAGRAITSATTSNSSPAPVATLARGFRLTSPAFRPNGPIPRQYTCDGRDASPPLEFSGVPGRARELVLVMRDPDAPTGNFVHWAIAGIPPRTSLIPAGGFPGQIIPGRNSFGSLGYRGPCPPRGDRAHHYVITLNALGAGSKLRPGFTADQLQTAAIGVATLVGTYRRR